jgi:hypothetical protein
VSEQEERFSNPEWRDTLLGRSPELMRYRRIFRHIPSEPRCKMCLSPQGGIGAPIMNVLGYGRYPPNPQLCNSCFRQAQKHPGGAEVEVTALFADIRGSTGLAERMSAVDYSASVDNYVRTVSRAVREPGGLVDKLLGDGVMALFSPASSRKRIMPGRRPPRRGGSSAWSASRSGSDSMPARHGSASWAASMMCSISPSSATR